MKNQKRFKRGEKFEEFTDNSGISYKSKDNKKIFGFKI